MSEAKWFVGEDGNVWAEGRGAVLIVVTSDGDKDEARSNRRLAVSAPKMLEALVELSAHLDFGEPLEPGEWGVQDPSGLNEAFALARAAIAEARDA